MLTDDEALAVLLGLVTSRRPGSVVAPPAPTSGRSAPRTDVLLVLDRAVRERRPVALTHTGADGQPTRRTVHPYGIVARSGHWYLSAADATSGDVRTLRVDRVGAPEVLAGSFDVPQDFDPTDQVTSALAQVPWRHEVSVRVHATVEQAASLFPSGLVTVEEPSVDQGWVRVRMRAGRLKWVPALLAALPVPFVVEAPEALRDLVRDLAERLTAAGETRADLADPPPTRTRIVRS